MSSPPGFRTIRLRALLVGLVIGLSPACSPTPSHSTVDREPAAPGDDPPTWIYEVGAGPGARELEILVSFAEGSGQELTLNEDGRGYVRDVEAAGSGGWEAVPRREGSWMVPAGSVDCRVRYRFLLAKAAEKNDVTVARADGGAIEAPPSTWLLRPVRASLETRFRFHVSSAPGESFATGVFPVAGAPDTYEAPASDMACLPYSAFGALRVHELEEDRLVAVILPGTLRSQDDVLDWIRSSARAVAGYYGRKPMKRLVVLVRPRPGAHVSNGTTMGHGGASITIDVGSEATHASLSDDWVLVHEMTHTALPDMQGPQHWLEEGLATYVEPLARAQAGIYPVERLWAEWLHGMPNGLPRDGDLGLDVTHTWGRTYWGGALFCLLADLEIRQRTERRKSLRDALRGILAAGGDISVSWPIERVIEVGDAATGVPVLRELYDKMKNAPVEVDLASIWKRLGVTAQGRGVSFDDTAPLAEIRRAMTGVR